MIVETSGFLDGRRVLITPISFREVNWLTKRFHLALTMDKVQNSPSVNVDKPVTRQHELDYYGHYRYPHYWGSSWFWGSGNTPGMLANSERPASPKDHSETSVDVHLRSANEVRGYHIQGSDEPIGHVEDFLVDDETWAIRYLVIDTSNWWVGKKVLIAPEWPNSISWAQRKVYFGMTRQSIENSSQWRAEAPINREYEGQLFAKICAIDSTSFAWWCRHFAIGARTYSH